MLFSVVLLSLIFQHSDVTLHQDVVRARIDVRVALKHNAQTLSDLTADDFTILENGHNTTIKGADRESVPLDLILMLDVSDSMNHVAGELTGAASDLLAAFAPADRISVVEFGGSILAQSDFSSDRESIVGAIQRAKNDAGKAEGATAIYDSVFEAVKAFKGAESANRRRAVLVVTDDIDNQSRLTSRELIDTLLERGVVLNAVVIGSPLTTATKGLYKFGPARFVLPPKSLKPIASETGGEFLPGRHSVELVKTALERIRARYLITYDPGASSGACARIQTELSRTARTRYPDAVIYGPRYRNSGHSAACR